MVIAIVVCALVVVALLSRDIYWLGRAADCLSQTDPIFEKWDALLDEWEPKIGHITPEEKSDYLRRCQDFRRQIEAHKAQADDCMNRRIFHG